MATYVVRNEADALRVLDALSSLDPDAHEAPIVRFEGWPKATVTVPEGIGVESARAVSAMEKIIHRQYCALKYGTFSLRHLTKLDREATKLDVTFPNPMRMVIDFSRAATATARAVNDRCEASEGFADTHHQAGLFATATDDMPKESWERAAREVGLKVVRKLSTPQIVRLAHRAIIVAGLVVTCPTLWRDTLAHHLAMRQHSDERQLKLSELDRTTVVAKSGRAIAPAARRAVERDMETNDHHIRTLVSLDFTGPFSRFVRAAEYARPALLDLANSSTIDINGLTLDAQTAKAAAKAIRRVPDTGWTAVVRPTTTLQSS